MGIYVSNSLQEIQIISSTPAPTESDFRKVGGTFSEWQKCMCFEYWYIQPISYEWILFAWNAFCNIDIPFSLALSQLRQTEHISTVNAYQIAMHLAKPVSRFKAYGESAAAVFAQVPLFETVPHLTDYLLSNVLHNSQDELQPKKEIAIKTGLSQQNRSRLFFFGWAPLKVTAIQGGENIPIIMQYLFLWVGIFI